MGDLWTRFMRAAFRGSNMGFRSMAIKPESSEVDYSNLLIAQIGVANKFKPTINKERLLETRSIDNNRKIFEDAVKIHR
jgi:hypothetical protein